MAQRLGGQSQARFAKDPPEREYDAISAQYVAQTKPANQILGSPFRNQARITFDAAVSTGERPTSTSTAGLGPGVLEALQRYAREYGAEPVIDLRPL